MATPSLFPYLMNAQAAGSQIFVEDVLLMLDAEPDVTVDVDGVTVTLNSSEVVVSVEPDVNVETEVG